MDIIPYKEYQRKRNQENSQKIHYNKVADFRKSDAQERLINSIHKKSKSGYESSLGHSNMIVNNQLPRNDSLSPSQMNDMHNQGS